MKKTAGELSLGSAAGANAETDIHGDDAVYLDEDGYPTDAALARIEKWPLNSVNDGLAFVASLWRWPDFGVSYELQPHEREIVHFEEGERYLRLATGGWSGNEDLIAAMEKNIWLRMLWRISTRGGLHIYQFGLVAVDGGAPRIGTEPQSQADTEETQR